MSIPLSISTSPTSSYYLVPFTFRRHRPYYLSGYSISIITKELVLYTSYSASYKMALEPPPSRNNDGEKNLETAEFRSFSLNDRSQTPSSSRAVTKEMPDEKDYNTMNWGHLSLCK